MFILLRYHGAKIDDGFRYRGGDIRESVQEWYPNLDRQNFFYLHGSLCIYDSCGKFVRKDSSAHQAGFDI